MDFLLGTKVGSAQRATRSVIAEVAVHGAGLVAAILAFHIEARGSVHGDALVLVLWLVHGQAGLLAGLRLLAFFGELPAKFFERVGSGARSLGNVGRGLEWCAFVDGL